MLSLMLLIWYIVVHCSLNVASVANSRSTTRYPVVVRSAFFVFLDALNLRERLSESFL